MTLSKRWRLPLGIVSGGVLGAGLGYLISCTGST